jgi:hypothetical protein
MKKFLLGVVVAALALLVFWLGKQFGSKSMNQTVLSNSQIVKEIAELASLEVQGNASIKRSNISGDDWTDNLKKTFLENTIWVTVPYVAKYGVNVDAHNFEVTFTEKQINVRLPEPQLLSYELQLDKMETANQKGLLLWQNDETYTDVQKKLYQESRKQLESNQLYVTQSKDKIAKIIKQYYEPFLKDHTLEVTFGKGAAQKLN